MKYNFSYKYTTFPITGRYCIVVVDSVLGEIADIEPDTLSISVRDVPIQMLSELYLYVTTIPDLSDRVHP